MSSTVQNGEILRLSPSMINAFDSSTSFGCERRWWLKYVDGQKEPTTSNQALGTELHAIIEAHLLGTSQPVEGQAAGLFLHGVSMVERVKNYGVRAVEATVDAVLDGIPLIGYCDVVLDNGIYDWKTTSDFKKYAKSPRELQTDTQMLLYARYFHPTREEVLLGHGYFQTKGRHVEAVETTITKKALDAHVENVIIPLVRKMKVAAKAGSHKDLPASPEKCRRCPFNQQCPTEGSAAMSSFFASLKKQSPAAVTPAPVVPPDAPPQVEAKAEEKFEPVPPPKRKLIIKDVEPVPPPAPAPVEVVVPEVVALPAEPSTPPAEPPKRGPGRPKGSKNKPKFHDPAPSPAESLTGVVMDPITATAIKALDENKPGVVVLVTVRHGVTINLGNYNSARVDVEMSGPSCGDEVKAREALSAKVMAALEVEASKYEAAKS